MTEQPQIELRPATSSDETRVLPMMRALAQQPPALTFEEGEIRATFRLFLSRPQFGRFWLENVGHAVGYIILTVGFSFEYRGHDAFIDELYIAPGFRRRGFASAAMQRAEECARELGVTAVHLEVDLANEPALELYRRIGYVDHDRRLMTKWLMISRP